MTGRRAVATLLGAVAIALMVSPAAAQPPPPVASARLQGTFQLLGTVTVARNVPGERAGQHVIRSWGFTSGCAAGPCSTVTLVRFRATGIDKLVLQRTAAGRYVGTAAFYAPLRCGRRTNPRGELVPFTIAVQVTAAGLVNGVVVASSLLASYVNRSRTNETACVAALGHDAAGYFGRLEPPPPASP